MSFKRPLFSYIRLNRHCYQTVYPYNTFKGKSLLFIANAKNNNMNGVPCLEHQKKKYYQNQMMNQNMSKNSNYQNGCKSRVATIHICKEDIKFSSGHFTIFSETEREHLHGHNFSVSCSLTGVVDEENGMIADYNVFKKELRKICSQLDEKFLLPLKSRFLKIFNAESENIDTLVIEFNGERMSFLKKDVYLLPVSNITGEELSQYLIQKLNEILDTSQLLEITISVSSSSGQSVSSTYQYEKNKDVNHDNNSKHDEHHNMSQLKTNSKSTFKDIKSSNMNYNHHMNNGESEKNEIRKYLVITGGSSGIGQSVIRKFLSNGYHIINLSRRPCGISNVRDIEIDLSKVFDIRSSIRDIPEGEICLIHCSASHPSDSIYDVDEKVMSDVMNLNVVAPAVLTSELLKKMKRRSSIIYVGSTLSTKAVSGRVSYVTSKHAMVGLMRATMQDLMGKGIHTACVCPGFTDTEMLQTATQKNKESFDRFISEFVSFGRLIKPEEMANLIFDVAMTPILNGSVLHANFGQKEY